MKTTNSKCEYCGESFSEAKLSNKLFNDINYINDIIITSR